MEISTLARLPGELGNYIYELALSKAPASHGEHGDLQQGFTSDDMAKKSYSRTSRVDLPHAIEIFVQTYTREVAREADCGGEGRAVNNVMIDHEVAISTAVDRLAGQACCIA